LHWPHTHIALHRRGGTKAASSRAVESAETGEPVDGRILARGGIALAFRSGRRTLGLAEIWSRPFSTSLFLPTHAARRHRNSWRSPWWRCLRRTHCHLAP